MVLLRRSKLLRYTAMHPNPVWKLAFLDASTFDRGDVSFDGFTRRWSCTFHPHSTVSEICERLPGVHVAVTNKALFNADVLRHPAAKDLKLIAIAATGCNNVDLDAAKARGIAVCNVSGYSTPSVAQHVFGLLLELASHAGRYHRDVLAGAWSRSPFFTLLTYPCVELQGKTLGLIGMGDIAQQVARIAEAFGMHVLAAESRSGRANPVGIRRVPLDQLLNVSDVISIHCPLNEGTRDLINTREFGLMKKSAFLINTARGGIVNEAALLAALKNRVIAGAGMDVLTAEPPPLEHPLVQAAATLDNLVLTPHSAWSTLESRQRLLDEVRQNIAAFEAGGSRNKIA